jgi:hypothetical protein
MDCLRFRSLIGISLNSLIRSIYRVENKLSATNDCVFQSLIRISLPAEGNHTMKLIKSQLRYLTSHTIISQRLDC